MISKKTLRNSREFAVILKRDRSNCFVLYTRFGILQEHQNSGALEVAAEINRPQALRIDAEAVMTEYTQNAILGTAPPRITMAELIQLSRAGTGNAAALDVTANKLYIRKRALPSSDDA